MKKSFDEILTECIAQLEASGGDIEAVLSRYPEEAAELRRYLQVWAGLSAAERAEASPQGVMRGRQQLLSGIAGAEQQKGGASAMQGVWSTRRLAMRFVLPVVAGAALALGVTFLTGNLDFGSGGSTAEAGPILDCLLQLDFNGDGQLTVGDIEAFRTAIQNQDPAFDLNGDTVVDVFDAVFAVKQVIACLQQIQPPIPTPPPLP